MRERARSKEERQEVEIVWLGTTSKEIAIPVSPMDNSVPALACTKEIGRRGLRPMERGLTFIGNCLTYSAMIEPLRSQHPLDANLQPAFLPSTSVLSQSHALLIMFRVFRKL